MGKPNIDISLEGVNFRGGRSAPAQRSAIDIPLDRKLPRKGGAEVISDAELDFVNRHHEEYKARRQKGGR